MLISGTFCDENKTKDKDKNEDKNKDEDEDELTDLQHGEENDAMWRIFCTMVHRV